MRDYYEEDLDEYEDEEGDELDGEAEEEQEEYEEEPPRQPTQEELEYLELRQRLKESIRKQMKKEGGTSQSIQEKSKKPRDNYGSFFGPSQPVISQRVIQESKSLIENKNLASRILTGQNSSRKNSSSAPSASSGSKPPNSVPTPRVNSGLKNKVQKLKNTRDYSFLLSDDAELPAPTKQPPPRNAFASNSDAKSAQLQQRNKQPSGDNGRLVNGSHQDRKAVGMNGYQNSKLRPNKPTSGKPSSIGTDSRKQIVNHGSGPGRPLGPKVLPPKTPISVLEKRVSASGAKTSTSGVQKPPSSKMQASISKQRLEQRREPAELNKSRLMSRPSMAPSKPQINKPVNPISSHSAEKKKASSQPIDRRTAVASKAAVQKKGPPHVSSQDYRPKKRPARPFDDDDDEDGGKAISMIRNMFGYNPNRYRDDDDDSDMEAGFDDIMEEEHRSALIAKREDEEQLRLIEEEERRERLRKKRKMMSH